MIASSTSASSTLRTAGAKDGPSRFIMHQSNATHMSPRWGFRIFACPVCYKHAAPLGLCWFISHWLIELISSAHIMEKVGTG